MRRAKPFGRRMMTCGVAAAMLTAAQPLWAQVAIGGKVGPNYASFSGEAFDDVSGRGGWAAGMFTTWALVEELSFQAEALYQQKGADVRLAGSGYGVDLDYAELAALFRLDVRPFGSGLTLYVAAGPAAAVNVRCGIDDGAGGRGCDDPDLDLSVRRFDFSMVGAGGFALPLDRLALFIEGRYSIGFGHIDAGPAWERTNHALAVLAGVSVPLRSRTRLAGH
ncbi:MAG TPA: porin family protein [Longimicrobiales bacterium]